MLKEAIGKSGHTHPDKESMSDKAGNLGGLPMAFGASGRPQRRRRRASSLVGAGVEPFCHDLTRKRVQMEEEQRALTETREQLEKEHQFLTGQRGEIYQFLYEHKSECIETQREKIQTRIGGEVKEILEQAKLQCPRHHLALACLEFEDFFEELSKPNERALGSDLYADV
jgi:hypothetical protein